jgi:hypothetical protein
MQNTIRLLAFITLFGAGIGALAISILCEDLTVYYKNKQDLILAEHELDSLRLLIATHDSLLSQLEKDPNMIKRIAPVVLGAVEEDPNVIYPGADVDEYITAKRALREHSNTEPEISSLPAWLTRSRDPRRRAGLFVSGAILVLIAFTCFGLPHTNGPRTGSG